MNSSGYSFSLLLCILGSLSLHVALIIWFTQPQELPLTSFTVAYVIPNSTSVIGEKKSLQPEAPGERPSFSTPGGAQASDDLSSAFTESGYTDDSPINGPGFSKSSAETETDLWPSEWERRQTLQRRSELADFFEMIAEKIDSKLIYRDELIVDGRDGVVTLSVLVNSSGQLVTAQVAGSHSSPQLRGFVLGVVRSALGTAESSVGAGSAIQASLEFEFRISHPMVSPSPPKRKVVGNRMFFYREGQTPARYDLTVHSIDDNILTRLFSRRGPDRRRVEWDLVHRRDVAVSACETQRASGACLEAGEIARSLGDNRNARRWLSVACEEKIERACVLLKNCSGI